MNLEFVFETCKNERHPHRQKCLPNLTMYFTRTVVHLIYRLSKNTFATSWRFQKLTWSINLETRIFEISSAFRTVSYTKQSSRGIWTATTPLLPTDRRNSNSYRNSLRHEDTSNITKPCIYCVGWLDCEMAELPK